MTNDILLNLSLAYIHNYVCGTRADDAVSVNHLVTHQDSVGSDCRRRDERHVKDALRRQARTHVVDVNRGERRVDSDDALARRDRNLARQAARQRDTRDIERIRWVTQNHLFARAAGVRETDTGWQHEIVDVRRR